MRIKIFALILVAAFLSASGVMAASAPAEGGGGGGAKAPAKEAASQTKEPEYDFGKIFSPLPKKAENPDNPLTFPKVELGRMLYFDPRLSKSSVISCNTCHNLATGGVDNLPTSVGHRWAIGPRNSPSVFNAALLTSQFWDGRAKDVEEQAKGPILNPSEMASTEELVIERLKSIPEYVEFFKKAFPGEEDPVTYNNVAKAIAAFERTLMTQSRFDFYLSGKKDAITPSEVSGLTMFVAKGCVNCHNGVGVGGNSFQKFDYGEDYGRFNVTGQDSDKKVFRVASLRNVELTYPYFHDGKVATLEEAVKVMGQKQLNTELTAEEVRKIVRFLKTLTGTNTWVNVPVLPPSTDKTPPPDLN